MRSDLRLTTQPHTPKVAVPLARRPEGTRSLHKAGLSWAEIGSLVGQRSHSVTADVYAHAMIDGGYRETSRAL